MDRRLLRNIPVLLWWVTIIAFLMLGGGWLVFIGAVVLVCATPFSKLILNRTDIRPIPLCTMEKFSELGNMTALSAVKAMVYAGRLPGPSKHRMMDRSKEELS